MAGAYVLVTGRFDAEAGLIAALLYSVYQPWGLWKNLAFNGEVLMNLPLVWAWAIGLGPARGRARVELLGAGALLCAGFLLKQPAAIAAVPLGLYFFHPRYRASRRYTWADSIRHAALLTIGFFGLLAAVCALLYCEGIFADALYWTITNHALEYFFWDRGVENTLAFAVACLPLCVAAWLSLRDRDLWAGQEAERFALLGWLAVSAIGAAAGGRFYPHYYIQLIPPLAALAAPHLATLWRSRAPVHAGHARWAGLGRWSARTTQVWLAATVVLFFIVNGAGLWLTRQESDAGQYVRRHSSSDDRMFVWGQAPGIYLDAERRPATRYIATFPLTGYIFGPPLAIDTRDRIVPGAWSNFEQDLRRHPPAFIVDTEVGADARYPLAQFPTLARLVATRYALVARLRDGAIYQRTGE
jgi:4-amino-4-deoxy-L-arabinose transferase-like glycosyltransferase